MMVVGVAVFLVVAGCMLASHGRPVGVFFAVAGIAGAWIVM